MWLVLAPLFEFRVLDFYTLARSAMWPEPGTASLF